MSKWINLDDAIKEVHDFLMILHFGMKVGKVPQRQSMVFLANCHISQEQRKGIGR